jgi:hypothetical protein
LARLRAPCGAKYNWPRKDGIGIMYWRAVTSAWCQHYWTLGALQDTGCRELEGEAAGQWSAGRPEALGVHAKGAICLAACRPHGPTSLPGVSTTGGGVMSSQCLMPCSLPFDMMASTFSKNFSGDTYALLQREDPHSRRSRWEECAQAKRNSRGRSRHGKQHPLHHPSPGPNAPHPALAGCRPATKAAAGPLIAPVADNSGRPACPGQPHPAACLTWLSFTPKNAMPIMGFVTSNSWGRLRLVERLGSRVCVCGVCVVKCACMCAVDSGTAHRKLVCSHKGTKGPGPPAFRPKHTCF